MDLANDVSIEKARVALLLGTLMEKKGRTSADDNKAAVFIASPEFWEDSRDTVIVDIEIFQDSACIFVRTSSFQLLALAHVLCLYRYIPHR